MATPILPPPTSRTFFMIASTLGRLLWATPAPEGRRQSAGSCAMLRRIAGSPGEMLERAVKDTDARLIALLKANAREPTASLARKLGLARSTVQERIARLEREGDRKSTRLNSSPR